MHKVLLQVVYFIMSFFFGQDFEPPSQCVQIGAMCYSEDSTIIIPSDSYILVNEKVSMLNGRVEYFI